MHRQASRPVSLGSLYIDMDLAALIMPVARTVTRQVDVFAARPRD